MFLKRKEISICIAILVIAVITTMIIMMITKNAIVITTADATAMIAQPIHVQVLVTAKSGQLDLEVKEVR